MPQIIAVTNVPSHNRASMANRRIPHLGHLCLFLLFTVLSFIATELLVLAFSGAFHSTSQTLVAMQNPRLQIIANMLCYIVALLVAYLVFPRLWNRPFLTGIHWNGAAARPVLALVGLAVGFAAQGVTTLLPAPKDLPMEDLFRNPAIIWLLVAFGTLLAPLFEEIVFRGFLLPGIAIAVDYLSLPKPLDPIGQPDPYAAMEVLESWRSSDAFSTRALVVSSILTSLCFGLIHAPQLGFSWSSVGLLALVSLVLCYVRLRTRSVAASTILHASYNLSVFITLFVATGGFRHLERAV